MSHVDVLLQWHYTNLNREVTDTFSNRAAITHFTKIFKCFSHTYTRMS
jgi:hypothetical protein